VALVLCTGAEVMLLATRKMLLQEAGHQVVTALEEQLIAACREHQFDVAVIGQALSARQKRELFETVRTYCPRVKVLELVRPFTGRALPEADDWLEVPAVVSSELAQRVSALAAKSD
jgi:DNA-binding NarL/FixJ family response regulator